MKKISYGVFGWNVAKLGEAVTALEGEGHFVRGYEIPKLSGYPFVEHDKLVFLEYAPDVLEAWKAKASEIGFKVTAEIDMPKTPRGYGDPAPEKKTETKTKEPVEAPLSVAISTEETVKGADQETSRSTKPAKKSG